jgi:hydroxyethylthiazole kinase
VDSLGDVAGIEEAAALVARHYGCVVAATGAADLVTDGRRSIRLHNNVPLLTRITGAGCMLGALSAATLAVAKTDPFAAAVTAIGVMCVAAEKAAAVAYSPGSFRPALIDAIAALTAADLAAGIRL